MKKIIIATLMICVVFCMLLSHKEYRNYKITNITLSEIVIKDCVCIYNHRTTKTNQKYPSVNL